MVYEVSFIISITFFGSYLFNYPKALIRFFVDQNNGEFFVSDLNLFTHRYAYINFFTVYLRYAPFAYLLLLFWCNTRLFKDNYFKAARLIRVVIYAHIVALFLNHYDFSYKTNRAYIDFFDARLNHIDFSYVLLQYSGAYWDLFFRLVVYYFSIVCLRENLFVRPSIHYEIIYTSPTHSYKFRVKKTEFFWSTLSKVWFFRLTVFLVSGYFFCGEGRLSDSLAVIRALVCIEFVLFSLRIVLILKAYKQTAII
jgi:hypothetical protein